MADKQRAYDTRNNADLFADDDPLAELARIVGFEPRVAANTVADAQPQEPAFNLEDELLREFERYEAPQQSVSFDRPSGPVFEQPADYVEPIFEAAVEPEMVQVHQLAHEMPAQWEAVSDAEAALAAAIEPQPDAHHVLASADWAAAMSRGTESASGGARDLIEELELSIGAAPAPAQPAKAPQWSAASIRLPLANFHTARREDVVAPVAITVPAPVEEPAVAATLEPFDFAPDLSAFEAPASSGFPAEIDRHEEVIAHQEPVVEPVEFQDGPAAQVFAGHGDFDLAAAARDGEIQADAALTEAAPADVDDIAFDIDDLLADVSLYPVPGRQLVQDDDGLEPIRMPEPAREVAAAPVVEPAAVPYERPVAIAKAEPEADDPFAGHDFELDLEGIELELADLDFAEPAKAQIVETLVAEPDVQPAVAYRSEPVPVFAPVYRAPVQSQFTAAPVSYAPIERPVAPVSAAFVADAGDELPFDPSMISDAEYHPEAVEEMHVPALPPIDQPVVVPASDFDFDVDSEIANLLAPAKQLESSQRSPEEWRTRAPISVAPIAPAESQPQTQSFDEFERALEEDFRRSVNEPVQPRSENVSQVQIQSASDAEDMSRARSMKRMLAAAAITVVFGGAAYAGYTFLARDGGLGVTSGEPRVIVAEKDPVKVVPENPGGKTVPNQDKAVYDSVGGAAAEAPKQKALVSSDEQPVDVVQRTLTPETLPEDNDGDVALPPMATPVGDTQDPRLLPNHAAADAADDADDAGRSPAVSARKVRTMIVKPDGTLVAREDIAPEPDQPTMPAATSVQTQKITPGAKPADGSAASFPASTQIASADIRSTPVEQTSPTAAQTPSENVLAKAAAATPADVDPPVRAVKSSTVSDAAPVPAVRPLAQSSKPAEAPAAAVSDAPAKPREVASAPPAATRVQPTPAAAGSYGMQIASLPSEEEAKKSYASLSKKFAGVLSGHSYEIRKAEIAGKGTFYRVRIPAGSKDEAAALCEQYRGAGGSCLISK